jgi:hypothetical protein
MSVENAREEFIKHVQNKTVLCAEIGDETKPFAQLNVGYSAEDYEAFLVCLDVEYHAGFGCQELFGHIWYADGTWSERNEYDGSEWWTHVTAPIIPDYMNTKTTKEVTQ